ncbi:COMDA protein, partial [Amia calva]|nr:COMDA protein [Amia calva]
MLGYIDKSVEFKTRAVMFRLYNALVRAHLAVYHNVKPASLKQHLANINLHSDKAEAFYQAWATAGQDTVEKFRQRMFAPKKLETVGWQLNLQMAQSTQAKMKSPHAVLELGVKNEDSEVNVHCY